MSQLRLRRTTVIRSALLGAILCVIALQADQSNKQPVSFAEKLAAAALDRTKHQVTYDPAYVVLDYPGGDVPADRGVCSDVVVRSYRALGVDLQKLVHEDMKRAFAKYPQRWV